MAAKRIIDIILSLMAVAVLLPLMLLLCVMVLLCLGRPILFKQERVGLYARPFNIYKFRTMLHERDGQGDFLPDEQRLTGFGKWMRRFSLDELPQLFNVIKGDLSLVGPRPLLVEYLERYSKEQARRHEVKPGITGWAQICGRNTVTWEERFKMDVWYVDNWSVWLDFKIMWHTLLKVALGEGISASNSATMPRFMGTKVEKYEEK